MAIRVTHTSILPAGTQRYLDTVPEIRAKYQEYKQAGKVTHIPNTTTVNENGSTTMVGVGVWGTAEDYAEYTNWYKTNYLAIATEWNILYGIKNTTLVVEE
jgi:hypothetical protein